MRFGRLLLLFIATASSIRAEGAPFASFAGDFSRRARVEVRGGQGIAGTGRTSLHFGLGKTGTSARLRIAGTLHLNGATRKFSALYIFNSPAKDGTLPAAITNLAPGVDDGYSAKTGLYIFGSRTIKANIPFVIGTTTGTASVILRLRKKGPTTQLLVEQTLSTNALPQPIIWRFQGLRHR